MKKHTHVFENAMANLQEDMVYDADDNNILLASNYITQSTFEFYGIAPFLGRSLEPGDYKADAAPVFVMRYKTWVEKFSADPSWIGKRFKLNGISRTLV